MGTLRERLRLGLQRTRERFSSAGSPGSDITDLEGLEQSLITSDLGVRATQEILEAVKTRGGDGREALRDELIAILERVTEHDAKPAPNPPRVTLVVGVNGVGKTTSIAKLAHQAVCRGESTMLIAADTFRAAATEQLTTWAERTRSLIATGAAGADPASVVHDGLHSAVNKNVEQVFVDTAGRLHNKKPLMDELAKVCRIAGRVVEGAPHDNLLVMDATVGSNGLAQAKVFADALPLTGIVLTKIDGTAKGGVVFSIARQLDIPVRYVGVGEDSEDLLAFSVEEFVSALLE